MCDFYKPVSKYYDLLSGIYSLGRVSWCRMAFLAEISATVVDASLMEVKVCFVGVGHGNEAIMAAECGAMVTVVDSSVSMLEVFQQKLNGASDDTRARVNIVQDDVRNVGEKFGKSFDWVVANFFLNVFSEPEMLEILDVLLGLMKKCSHTGGGGLVIGDFCYDSEGSKWVRMLQKLNWNIALWMFRVFVKNAKHPIYDYREYLSVSGWTREKVMKFRILGVSFYLAVKYVKSIDSDKMVDFQKVS